jgi:hypothetical protein
VLITATVALRLPAAAAHLFLQHGSVLDLHQVSQQCWRHAGFARHGISQSWLSAALYSGDHSRRLRALPLIAIFVKNVMVLELLLPDVKMMSSCCDNLCTTARHIIHTWQQGHSP